MTDPVHPAEHPDEELPEQRPGQRRTRLVVAGVVAAAVAIAVAGYLVVGRRDEQRAAPPTRTPSMPRPTLSIPPNPTSAPEQDAITALNRCGGNCVTYTLSPAALRALGMRGLTSASGVRVTDGRREYLRSVVGRSGATDVRLLYERVADGDAALRVTDSRGPGRTVVLAVIRHGWRLTATLVGQYPPIAAATAWALAAPVPD